MFTMQETIGGNSPPFLIRYRSGGTPARTNAWAHARRLAGRCPRNQDHSRPRDFPALPCRPPPLAGGGFGRRHILARPVGLATATTSTPAVAMAEEPVTYEDLPEEHKKRYNEIKAVFEADLIGSFERTRTHGIKWKGFSPEGVLDEVDLSVPSEERTRALRQEVNYMVAHSLHRHAETLVNAFERIAVSVVQEIMKHQYSPSGPALGTHQGERTPYKTTAASHLQHQSLEGHQRTSSTRSEAVPMIASSCMSHLRRFRMDTCARTYQIAIIQHVQTKVQQEGVQTQTPTSKRG